MDNEQYVTKQKKPARTATASQATNYSYSNMHEYYLIYSLKLILKKENSYDGMSAKNNSKTKIWAPRMKWSEKNSQDNRTDMK